MTDRAVLAEIADWEATLRQRLVGQDAQLTELAGLCDKIEAGTSTAADQRRALVLAGRGVVQLARERRATILCLRAIRRLVDALDGAPGSIGLKRGDIE